MALTMAAAVSEVRLLLTELKAELQHVRMDVTEIKQHLGLNEAADSFKKCDIPADLLKSELQVAPIK